MSSCVWRSTKGNEIWLPMHPRNFGSDNIAHPYIHPFMLADVKCHTYQLGVQANKNYIDLARAKSEAPVYTF